MPQLTSGEVMAALGIIGGVISFAIGLYRYHIAQKWKKSEFAAKLPAELATDERLTTCCKLLDYSTRKLPVPSQYRLLTHETIFPHNQRHTMHGTRSTLFTAFSFYQCYKFLPTCRSCPRSA